MELAANLLAKALRTDFDGEAIALVEKSYSLLAKVITADPAGAYRRLDQDQRPRDRGRIDFEA
jgi:hypothetical protein